VSTIHTEAIVLRAVDFGESDRIVHLLAPATGRLAAIAKGARRSRKRFPGTLDFFNHLDVQIERRRPTAMARLEHARLRRSWASLRERPTRFALGCYLLEMLDRLAPEGGAPEERRRLFAFALGALDLVEAAEPDARLRTLLELRTLAAAGLRPELRRCVRCGRSVLEEGRGAAPLPVGFHVAEGGPCCPACAPPGHALLPVHPGTLRALEQSLRFELPSLGRIALGGAALREAHILVARFLRFHLGLELRSERFLDERLTLPEPQGTLRPLERAESRS
jgi:DNA repair protein RecO (recombination protein O)